MPSDARLAMYSAFLGSLHILLMMMLQRPVGSAAATPVVPVSARHAAEYLNWAGPAQHRERRLEAYATGIVARRNSEFDRAQGPTPVNLERGQHVLVNHPPYGGFELGGPYNSAINHVAARAKSESMRALRAPSPIAALLRFRASTSFLPPSREYLLCVDSGDVSIRAFAASMAWVWLRTRISLARNASLAASPRPSRGLGVEVPSSKTAAWAALSASTKSIFAGSPAGFGALQPKGLHT